MRSVATGYYWVKLNAIPDHGPVGISAGAKMKVVTITREPVELYKILKFEGLVDSGGAAKNAVADGLVLVNGEVETRKRRQIVSGDIVKFGGETLQIELG